MDIGSLFSEIIPTMVIAWIFVIFLIVFFKFGNTARRRFFGLIEPLIKPEKKLASEKEEFSLDTFFINWYHSFRATWLSAPNNIRLALQSAWRGRELSLIHISEPTRPY